MERNPIQNDVREAQRQRRLPPDAVCIYCGERDPRTLVVHHGVGRANDEKFTVVVCRNCHAKHHDEMAKTGVTLEQDANRPWLETLASMLTALGVLLLATATAVTQWAQRLYAEIDRPDTAQLRWENHSEASI